ncbi:MAG: hypothetical protein ACJAUE_001706 [Alcanivorax sp.]|jgi:hypothetical protein
MVRRDVEFKVESSKFKNADQAILRAKQYPRTNVRCAEPPNSREPLSCLRVSTLNFELLLPTQPVTAATSLDHRHNE